jgi:preflagellin peptidase FlaK
MDLKIRKVQDCIWKLMLLSQVFLFYEAVKGQTSFLLQLFTSFLSIFFLVYLLFRIRIFGSADAKALIVIGILFPVYPALKFHGYYFSLLGVPPLKLFAFTVLENAFLLTAAVSLGLRCYNFLHFTPNMLKKPLYMFFAYK